MKETGGCARRGVVGEREGEGEGGVVQRESARGRGRRGDGEADEGRQAGGGAMRAEPSRDGWLREEKRSEVKHERIHHGLRERRPRKTLRGRGTVPGKSNNLARHDGKRRALYRR